MVKRMNNLSADPNPRAVVGGNAEPTATANPANEKFLADTAKKLSKVVAALSDNKALSAASGKSRMLWATYGQLCSEAREVLSSNKGFNAWLTANALADFCDRNTRSDAIWLHKMPEDFVADVVPAEIANPRVARVWFRKTVKDILDNTGGNDSEEALAALDAGARTFIGSLPTEIWAQEVAAYKAKPAATSFNASAIAEAVAKLMAKIMTHDSAAEVAAALVSAIDAENARGAAAWTTSEPASEPATEPTTEPEPSVFDPEPVE